MPTKQQRKYFTGWMTGLALITLSCAVQAVPINGTIGFSGAFNPLDAANAITTLDVATGIDFVDDRAVVLSADGDFSPLVFTAAAFTDFQFNPLAAPVSPLWTAGVFSFDLMSVTITSQSASALRLEGLGVVSRGGVDATVGNWSFSGDTNGTGGSAAFAWSAGTQTVVPEPQQLALLGLGLLVMGVVRRRKWTVGS